MSFYNHFPLFKNEKNVNKIKSMWKNDVWGVIYLSNGNEKSEK